MFDSKKIPCTAEKRFGHGRTGDDSLVNEGKMMSIYVFGPSNGEYSYVLIVDTIDSWLFIDLWP